MAKHCEILPDFTVLFFSVVFNMSFYDNSFNNKVRSSGVASFTPSVFLAACSILFAQFAQSTSIL